MTATLDAVATYPDRGQLQLGVRHSPPAASGGSESFDPGRVSLLFTTSTPGASDGLAGDPQPVLVVWGPGTAPIARIALRDRLVATGWAPFAPQCTSDDPTNHQGDTCPVHESAR